MIIGLSGFAGVGKDTVADALVRNHGFVKVGIADQLKRSTRDIFNFSEQQLWGPSQMREAPDERYPREHTWARMKQEPQCVCCGEFLLDAASTKQCYLTPRYALQLVGTEACRHCYNDIWIECALQMARRLLTEELFYDAPVGLCSSYGLGELPRPNGVVLSDVRFRNELGGIHRFGLDEDLKLDNLLAAWHSDTSGADVASYLGMSDEEYKTYVEVNRHRLSSYVVRVKRPGFEEPRYQHQSELEQQSFKDDDFNYVFVGGATLDGLDEKVAVMLSTLRGKPGVGLSPKARRSQW